jgi:DNA (cytosine-5)-methyltransferase 1
MKHGSLFSGIGGFDLASDWMGWDNVFHCEIESFPRKILHYYWPSAISYEDIKKTDFTIHKGRIDILTGGFPCQPYSMAGKRKGKEDERHLWPEMLRAIREIQPRWIVGENVLGLVNWNDGLVFDEVQSDLEAEGYEVQTYVLPAAAVGAPHRRDRVWFIAYAKGQGSRKFASKNRRRQNRQSDNNGTIQYAPDTNSNGCNDKCTKADNQIRENNKQSRAKRECSFKRFSNEQNAPDTNSNGCDKCNGNNEKHTGKGRFNALNDFNEATMHTNGTSKQGEHIEQTREGKFNGPDSRDGFNNFQNFPTQSPICGGDDGLPTKLDGITFPKWRNESIKGYGNAIVPQVVYQIFKAIQEYENLYNESNSISTS